MLDFDLEFNDYLSYFNDNLDRFLTEYTSYCPKILADSIKYAVIDGGKRIRPILCLATADMLGLDKEYALNYGYALEFIHSYSLVHDDLPAMDNDDFRRGKPSTHKKFGEAYGILAGDGLLNLAMEACLAKSDISENDVKAMRVLFSYSGAKGMVAGQVLDLQNEKNSNPALKTVLDIYENKTAKLIMAPVLIASLLANGEYYAELKKFSYDLGILFQITDDIMDVEGDLQTIGKTPNKDEKVDKLTAIKVLGLDMTKRFAEQLYLECKAILQKIPNSDFLQAFTDKMYLRKS